MIVGQEYYRTYVTRGVIKHLISHIVEISDGIAYLANGKRFDASTGLECDTDEAYIWQPLSIETKAYIQRHSKANKARKWFKKILELDEVAINLHQQLNTNVDVRRYYHHLTPDEREELQKQTVAYIKKNYKQPYWCGHQNAFEGVFGCEKLITGKPVSPGRCFLCQCYVQPKMYQIWARLRNLAMIPVLKMNQFLKICDYEDIEMGNREPTEKEMALLMYAFGMDQWTMEECRFFLLTEGTEKRKDDPMFKKWGDMARYRVNLNSIFNENSNIKTW